MTRKRLITTAILAAAGALIFLFGLGRLTATRQQEMRVALVARHMATSGDWLIPEFRGQPRLRKPPLMYWMVAAAFKAAGTTSSAAVARLPSALSGLALVLVIGAGGARLVGRRRALLAAVAAVTSFGLIRHARLAETDVLLTLLVTLTVLWGRQALLPHASPWAWPLAGIFAGLGFLAKGPAALVLPVLALALFAVFEPASRRRFLSPGVLAAVILCAAIGGSWYLAVFFRTSSQGAAETAVGRELHELLGGVDHPGPFYYYLHALPKAMLPWSLLIPFGLWIAWKQARRHAGARFLLCWFVSSFVALSLLKQKQDHYALLLLPPTALMIGLALAPAFSRRPSRMRSLSVNYLVVLEAGYTLAGLALILAPLAVKDLPSTRSVAAGAVLLAAGSGLLFNPRGRRPGVRVVGVLVLAALGTAVYAWLPGDFSRSKTVVPQFAAAAAPRIANARVIHVVGGSAALLEFYLGERARSAGSFSEAWAGADPGDAVVVSGDRDDPLGFDLLHTPAELTLLKKDLVCLLFVKPPTKAEAP